VGKLGYYVTVNLMVYAKVCQLAFAVLHYILCSLFFLILCQPYGEKWLPGI
jgi:hypothetical protein